jgi:hypothetical protein
MKDVEALLAAATRDFGITLENPSNDNQKAVLECLKGEIRTAREVKRLIGAFSVLEEAVRGEVCPYDVLGYSWLLTKAPSVRDSIALNEQGVVDDPDESELIARSLARVSRGSNKLTAADILGPHARPQEQLLALLFPRFGSEKGGEGNRISRRRNLARLLYMGNPPGMFRRQDIERLWNKPDVAALEVELRRIQEAGELPQFLDRLDDLLPDLPPTGDNIFWVALSRLFVRRSDWISQAEGIRSLADDAATSLTRLGLRNRVFIPRVKRALEALIDSSDLVLVPWILRKHMFAHGLSRNGVARGGESILTSQETSDLLEREAPRYRQSIETGVALRRLANVEAIYVLSNAGRWDNELRTNFTRQLDCMSALATFAALVVPPGYWTDRSHFYELFDADIVGQSLEQVILTSGLPADPWVAAAVGNLRAILCSADPMVLNGD